LNERKLIMKKALTEYEIQKRYFISIYLIIFALIVFSARFTYLQQIEWPITTPDSPSYFQLELWGNQRLYTVPAVFKLLGSHELIVIFNIILGVLAWTAIAHCMLKLVRDRKALFQTLSIMLLAALATSTPTFISDFYVMSESINISLSLLLFASVFRFHLNPTSRHLYLLVLTYTIWLVAKQAHLLTSIFTLAGLVALIFWKRKFLKNRIWHFAMAYLITFNTIIFFQLFEPTPTSLWNAVAVVYFIISRKASWIDWFYEQGWPRNYVSLDAYGNPNISEAISNSVNSEWLQSYGVSVFRDFLLHHPEYIAFGAFFLPIVGGLAFSWNETVGASFIFGSRWNNGDFPSIPANHLNYWWFDNASAFWKVILILVFFIIIFLILQRHSFSKSVFSSNSMFVYLMVVVVTLLRANFEWLVAPGDRQRIWPEHATLIRVCFLFIFLELLGKLHGSKKS